MGHEWAHFVGLGLGLKNGLRAALIWAVKGLCVQNDDKTKQKETELSFFSFFLSLSESIYLYPCGWRDPPALWELPGN